MDKLTPEECQAIIEEDREWSDLDMTKSYGGGVLHCKQSPVNVWGEKYPDVILYECLMRYDEGDFAEEHTDQSLRGVKPGYVARAVWITPLNDDYEGGELYFNGELVEQEVGITIKRHRAIPHEVKKITKGTRYSLVSWQFVRTKENTE